VVSHISRKTSEIWGTRLLFGVQPNDPVVFLSIITAISLIAFLVSWGPAHQAASIDPMTALRTE
jgi:ABC-type lipoprotein release transport system permease subunit